MGKYFKYNAGDVINGVLMIRRTQKIKNNWYGEFQCPCCGKPFEAQIQHIRLGDVKNCGCDRVYGFGSPNYPDNKRNTLDLTNKKFGKVKNQWCYKNSIDLIRIPYQERNNLDTALLTQLIIEREVSDGSYCKILLHC